MPEPTRRILIVDDEPDMCWALEHILSKSGYISQKALSGQEALQLLQEHQFRLVFLDAKLQDSDGLELARNIRHLNPDIRIVMVSGYFFPDDAGIQKALSEDLIHGFISKPFLQAEILKALSM